MRIKSQKNDKIILKNIELVNIKWTYIIKHKNQ